MLCALNRERRRHLPVNRIELYKACCSLLLDRRDKESRIDLTDYPSLSYGQKQRLLEDLAYQMIQENLSEVAVSHVDESFTRKVANMQGIVQDISGMQIRRLLVERSGIIREPVAGQIDFAHRTFQEFFAAQAALDVVDVEKLVANADNYQWRDVIILAAGLASKAMCEQLVTGLISRGDNETTKELRYQLYLLAVSCLETAIELGPLVKANVEQRLKKLVPPKNMTDAKALVVAGELAIKHLAKKGKLSVSTSTACVRALVGIGGDAALDMLEEYANDGSEAVIKELLKAWDSFDREVFAKRILSRAFRETSAMHLERASSVDGIQYLPCLTSLELYDCSRLRDFTPLIGLTSLNSLTLSDCSLDNLNLTSLASLPSIDLSQCSPDNLNLADLPCLAALDLSHCSHLSDLNLADLPCLTALDLFHYSQLSKLYLTDLTSLTTLDLSYSFLLNSLSLSGLTNLTSLDLDSCSLLIDLSIMDLPNLTSLELTYCYQLNKISLMRLSNLTSLDLYHCTDLHNLNNLADLNKLKILRLSDQSRSLIIPVSIKEKLILIDYY